jgi:hypothetical protein
VGVLDSVRYQRYQDDMSKDEIHFAPDGEPQPFTVPLPPPFPPGRGDRVLFIRSGEDEEGKPREHEDLMLRRVPRETAMRFRAAAGGRGMTHAQYLVALVELHGHLRERAEAGDESARALLDELGLQSVTV